MDPSVLLRAYKSPQYPDPVEEYKGFLSLRQMMDLGKQRQQQYQIQQLEMQQKQRDMAEYEQYRTGVGQLGPNFTLEEAVRALGPKYGPAHFKLQHEAQTARNQQLKAQSEQDKAALDLGQTRAKNLADMAYANSLLPENERQVNWDEEWGGIPADLPPTQPQVQALIARGYGGEKQQTMANAAATAARAVEEDKRKVTEADLKTTQEQGKIAGGTLGFVADQPSLTKWYNELPAFWRSRIGPPPTYNAATMDRLNRMFQTAEQRQQAIPNSPDEVIAAINNPQTPREDIPRLTNMLGQMIKYRQDVRPVIGGDTTGIVDSVLKNPETYAGLPAETKGAILPALTARGFKPPPPEDYKKRLIAIRDTRNALAQYRKHLETYDPLMRPGTPKFARMQTAYRSLQLRAKEAANLGALNGPDMQLLNETLGDPTSWMGRYAGADTLTAQADEYGSILDNSESTLRETYGQPAAGTPNQPSRSTPAAPSTPTATGPARTSQPIPNPIVEVKRGPDGKLR